MITIRALAVGLTVFASASAYANQSYDNDIYGLEMVTADDISNDRVKCRSDRAVPKKGIVDRVVDGDTMNLRVKEGVYSVRFVGIDTPESYYKGQSQGIWAEKAKETLQRLLPEGTGVTLRYEADSCDTYGRLLAHVFKGKEHINKKLAEKGLAVNYCVAPSFKYCQEIGDSVDSAMHARKGMFTDSNVELPYDFRRRVSGAPQRSYVGDLETKEVYRPGNQDRVDIPKRVFFFTESRVQDPFHIVE
jgi:micrococcal nuclease